MTDRETFALKNAAASSVMEGLPLSPEQLNIAEEIIDGNMTLQDYYQTLQSAAREA